MSKEMIISGVDLAVTGAELTEVGLTLPPKLPPETWSRIGQRVGQFSSATQWAIGDWWNYGEHNYGDRAEIINGSGWNGPSYESCAQYAKICRRYQEPGTRVPGLTFKHHEVVAWLSIDARTPLLQKALREKLTVAELKAIARQVGGRGARDTGESETRSDEAADSNVFQNGNTSDAPAGFDEPEQQTSASFIEYVGDPDADAPDETKSIDFAAELLAVVSQLETLNRQCAAPQLQREWEASPAMQRRLARLDRLKDFLGCK